MKQADAQRVTEVWSRFFPEFTVWQPLRLIRRIGPVLQGIMLDPSSSGVQYYPTAHVHSLTRDFPVVTLSLAWRVRRGKGSQGMVGIDEGLEVLEGLAALLVEQSPLSLRSVPTLTEIVNEYRRVASEMQRKVPSGVVELEDSVVVPTAGSAVGLAEESFRLAADAASKWSKYEAPMGWVSTDDWLANVRANMSTVDRILETVEAQVVKHKLDSVVSVPLIQ